MRVSVKGATRFLERFARTLATDCRPSCPSDLTPSLLRSFAKWLKDESGLGYRAAGCTYRVISPFLCQWVGQPWMPKDFAVPRFLFPHVNDAVRSNEKGYSLDDLRAISRCVLADIKAARASRTQSYSPRYLGSPAPMEGVAPSAPGRERRDKWLSFEHRVWWWETQCRCLKLSVDEVLALRSGETFVFGGARRKGDHRTRVDAQKRLDDFYAAAGAGPAYVPRYAGVASPVKYATEWASPEYVRWYWENYCECKWMSSKELKTKHRRLHVALREHHSGIERFYEDLGVVEPARVIMEDLAPYYVGLLMSGPLNPSAIRALRVDDDLLKKDPLDSERESVLYTKMRAHKVSLTIPASYRFALSPANLAREVLAVTAPIRTGSNPYLFLTNGKGASKHMLSSSVCHRAVKAWFEKHSLERTEAAREMIAMHNSMNFRPAAAREAYERTGSIQHVKSLLGHSRVATTVDYIGRLPNALTLFSRGVHIEAIFVGATEGPEAALRHIDENLQGGNDSKSLTETSNAHCQDIHNSPFPNQKKRGKCIGHNGCLYCANLAVTHSDIVRYFAANAYYRGLQAENDISVEEYNDVMGEREFMFTNHILPKYHPKTVAALKAHAEQNPPPEYRR